MFFIKKIKRRILICLISVLLVCDVIVTACAVYLADYYKADEKAIAAYLELDTVTDGAVTQNTLEDNTIIFLPEMPTDKGFIFYPGGKVEHTAYIPLMEACAARGIFCVLLDMPFNLAVLDINAADGIREAYPEIESWYIGGHSLGGSMAAAYLEGQTDSFEGLVLLGSYSTADLSATDVRVLSVYGSEDGVMNREKYEENIVNLPSDYTELVIEGGCHAYFGMYGAQDGDGVATITPKEQINITANAVSEFLG